MCIRIKVKQSHNTRMEEKGDRRYSSYSFVTSVLYGGKWSESGPGCALPPGKGPLLVCVYTTLIFKSVQCNLALKELVCISHSKSQNKEQSFIRLIK
jgi:hypothetical protein